MAIPRVDETLEKAVSSDHTVIPRYDLIDPSGRVVATNVQLQLKNKITDPGMPINKVAMDECLAASGTTGGTATAYTLQQANFALFDGALVRVKLHVDSGATPTLNVNGTGAKKLMVSKYLPIKVGIPAGTWITLVYCKDFDFFVQQGSGATDNGIRIGQGKQQVSTYERYFRGLGNTHYWR